MPRSPQLCSGLVLPGQEGGDALADILYGPAEPGGRLPTTSPQSADGLPRVHPTDASWSTGSGTWWATVPEIDEILPSATGCDARRGSTGSLKPASRATAVLLVDVALRATGLMNISMAFPQVTSPQPSERSWSASSAAAGCSRWRA
ncbi:glycoside hydrolase family 3 C-terminal domain-containing protein [Streptomyces sp. S186]|uniref:glycoside hydrolase family 3 C-terminal domain-containing protein n=1 Tax=Streptomyces sp. S186 TaxID=3434395 RepID=UPI003F666049